MDVNFEAIEPIVNSLIVMTFMASFGFAYCNRETDELSGNLTEEEVQAAWNFDMEFMQQEDVTFKELERKIDEGLNVIETTDEKLKKVEEFIESGVASGEFAKQA